MHGIEQRVTNVRRRQQWQWSWQCASWGLFAGGLAATAIAALMFNETVSRRGWPAVAALLIAGPIAGVVISLLWRRRMHGAAVQIDRSAQLKDRIATAWSFLSRGNLTPVQQLQIDDAEQHSAAVEPTQVAPFRVPGPFPLGVLLSAAALMLAFMAPVAQPVVAAVADPAVVNQALRLEEGLEDLQKFNMEEKDPEVEKLLQELAETLEQLKQPGVDPKETLAKLSQMEAALEAQQQQLASPQMDAQMKQLGEALSLAEPLASAGQALEQGEYEKAAEEMERQDLPKLDRQTERAIIEKLEKLKQGAADGAQGRLAEGIGQASAGLSSGNRKKFKGGMQTLAGQARRMGRRKKLSNLLKTQTRALQQMKDDWNWGTGATGNKPGEKTSMLKTSKTLDLKGQESAEGDVDVETVQSAEQQQDVTREYREKIQKYEQLSESVLESEPIPLGHRQTIRRYFELIRPQAEQVDAVLKATQPTEPPQP